MNPPSSTPAPQDQCVARGEREASKVHFGTPPGFWQKAMSSPAAVRDISRAYETNASVADYMGKRINYTDETGKRQTGKVYATITAYGVVKVRRGSRTETVALNRINHIEP